MKPSEKRTKVSKIVAFSVFPFFRDGDIIVQQADGADNHTQGWAVYQRYQDDSTSFVDEWPSERDAVTCAQTLAKFMQVPVDPYHWQRLKAPSLADSKRAFEFYARDQPFIKDVQFFPVDHHDKRKAGTYGHFDTQNAKTTWDAACEWMRSVFGAQM